MSTDDEKRAIAALFLFAALVVLILANIPAVYSLLAALLDSL